MPATIRQLTEVTRKDFAGLCDVLIDCVEGGASVSFMKPMSRNKAESFWTPVVDEVVRGDRLLLVAEEAGEILGTVQVVLKLPENQPHRGDVVKMLVRRSARRRGLGAELLGAAEKAAVGSGRSLLVLDTVTGADGDRLYARCGWQRSGDIPRFALLPDGGYCSTTVYYKWLGP
ncbi:MAG TPA: GNAT family N-acetyltransferase [Opitutaceae bacterium]|jgi:GNAT superfamily N-acetyltransferase